MFDHLKKQWRELKRSTPGERFEEQYKRRKEQGSKEGRKPIAMILGVLLVLVGIFFMLVPGPGLPILLVGAVLISQQSLVMARFLDRLEVQLRRLFDWALGLWQRGSMALKIACVALMALIVGSLGWIVATKVF